MDGLPQRLVGGDAGQLQLLGQRDKEGVVDSAVVLDGNFKRGLQYALAG